MSGVPGGRSESGWGRTRASAWRRPSRPRVAHGTRLSGPPLTVVPVHRLASSSSMMGVAAEAPSSILRMDRPYKTYPASTSRARVAACPGSRHSCGPPGSAEASARPPAEAARCSAYAAPVSPASTPPATASERALEGVASASASKAGLGMSPPTPSPSESSPTSRRRSSAYVMASPTGTASGNAAIRPCAPRRASSALALAWLPSSAAPATPVVAKRQPTWRSRPRAGDSWGRCVTACRSANPSGMIARSASRVRARSRRASSRPTTSFRRRLRVRATSSAAPARSVSWVATVSR